MNAHFKIHYWKDFKITLLFFLCYFLTAYLLLPQFWKHYEHRRNLEKTGKTTYTAEGLPGDPLNVGFEATRRELHDAFQSAGWTDAEPLKFSSGVKITERVLMNLPYADAPVSNLYLFGRLQDISFEKQMGPSPRQRHHVRLWQSRLAGQDGRPLWLGAVSFDRSVGLSHVTGEITHHIAPDIDQERDKLMEDLIKAGQVVKIYQVTGIGPSLKGRNGAGDWYFTDGELRLAVLSPDNRFTQSNPQILKNPAPIELKNDAWVWIRKLFDAAGARH